MSEHMPPPPAVPLAPGWHDDPESPTRLRYYDGAAWTNRTSDKAAPFPASAVMQPSPSAALEEAVNDALREGYAVQSRLGDTVVVAKRRGVSGGSVFAYLLGIVLLFPIGLLFIIPWVNASKKLARLSLRQLPDGSIERQFLWDKPVAASAAREQSNAPTARFARWLGASTWRIVAFVVGLVMVVWVVAAIIEVVAPS